MHDVGSAASWSRRRRRISTMLIAIGIAVRVLGIVFTATVFPERFSIVFLFAGTGVFTGGLIVRYLADPVFAPRRSPDEQPDNSDRATT